MALVTLRMRDTPLTQEFYFRHTLRPASTPPPHDSAEPTAPERGAELPRGGQRGDMVESKAFDYRSHDSTWPKMGQFEHQKE